MAKPTNPLSPSAPGLFRHPHGARCFFDAWSRAVRRANELLSRPRSDSPQDRERSLLVSSGVWGEVVGRWSEDYARDLVSDALSHRRHGEQR